MLTHKKGSRSLAAGTLAVSLLCASLGLARATDDEATVAAGWNQINVSTGTVRFDFYEDVLIDSPRTVAFLDPPYMPDTRVELGVYPHEFTHEEHRRMLHAVCNLRRTKVILCGYRNALHRERLSGWRRLDFETKSYAGPTIKGRKLPSRVLSIWMNYA